MPSFVDPLFAATDLRAPWGSENWSPALGWLHVASEIAIFGAYFAITAVLVYFVRRRRDVPFPPVFWLFAAFILSCGVAHLIDATLYWHEWYRLSAGVKLFTALVSWVTVFALIPVLPKALALPPLADVNARLTTEIEERARIERELRHAQELLKAANTALRRISQTDALTQLPNRRALDERLGDEVARAARYPAPLSAMVLDVDHFKTFNDTFGHPAGDEVLRAVAGLLRSSVRETDLVARFGGEEFVVLMPSTGAEEAGVVAERCRRAVEGAAWPHRAITVSVGVATAEAGAVPTGEALLTAADQALYRAKEAGRNRVERGHPANAG